MITNIGSQIAVDVDPAEFQMQDWSLYRSVPARLMRDRDAHSEIERHITFTLAQQGSDISIDSVTIKVALTRAQSWVVTSKQSKPPGGTDHGRDQTAQTRWTQRFWQSLTSGNAL